MPRKMFILLLTFLLIPFGTVFADHQDQGPREVLTKAYDAYLAGDAEQYAKYVEDRRFDTKGEAITLYENLIKEDPLVNYEILKEREINSNTYIFLVREVNGTTGTILDIPVTVKKKSGSWQIEISEIPFMDDDINIVNAGNDTDADIIISPLTTTLNPRTVY